MVRDKRMAGTRNSTVAVVAVLGTALALTGCVGGTTYGTGVSHERQTFEDMYNILRINRPQRQIAYEARPGLIVPENKEVLPEPAETAAVSDPDWPESPEQRIARIRSQAPDPDERSGNLPTEYLTSEKEGIRVDRNSRLGRRFVPGQTDRDGYTLDTREHIEATRNDALRRRAELNRQTGTSTQGGPKRRYLTEPPVEYREPFATAASGEAAYSPEELEARREAEKKAAREKSERIH